MAVGRFVFGFAEDVAWLGGVLKGYGEQHAASIRNVRAVSFLFIT